MTAIKPKPTPIKTPVRGGGDKSKTVEKVHPNKSGSPATAAARSQSCSQAKRDVVDEEVDMEDAAASRADKTEQKRKTANAMPSAPTRDMNYLKGTVLS